MPITLPCPCGKSLRVPDTAAGKQARCPACKAVHTIPAPAAEEDPGFEVLPDEAPADDVVFEVVEKPAARTAPEPRPTPVKVKPARDEDDDDTGEKPAGGLSGTVKKKKKKKRSADKESGLAAALMGEAHEALEREEDRRSRGGYGNDGGGRTIFGITLTAGVLSGAGLVFTGLVGIILLLMFQDTWGLRGGRAFVYAIICLAIGLLTLLRSLLFGEED